MAKICEAEDFELEEYNFTPKVYEKNGFIINDYTGIEHNKIFLVNKKDILKKTRPDWIPEFNGDGLFVDKYLPCCAKDSDGTFYVLSKTKNSSEKKYYRMSLDILAATVDYYLKYRRAELKQKQYNTKGVRLPNSQHSMYRDRYYGIVELCRLCDRYKDEIDLITDGDKSIYSRERSRRQSAVVFHEQWIPLLNEIKDKRYDLNLQKIDYIESHAKGRNTAYGDINCTDEIKDKYGFRIKKQNGKPFKDLQIERLKNVLESTWSFYGNLTKLVSNNNVKLSYADNCYQYCSRSLGVWAEFENCIGISFFEDQHQKIVGEKTHTPDITMIHETAHWLDALKGKENDRFYASDNEGSPENVIANLYKKKVREKNNKHSAINGSTKKLGEYWYRTCECFARTMEQTYAYEHGIDMGVETGYLDKEDFIKDIYPLTKALIKQNKKYFGIK